MKVKNIKYSCVAYNKNGKLVGQKFCCSEKAMCNWANKWFNIDEESKVEIHDFKTDILLIIYQA